MLNVQLYDLQNPRVTVLIYTHRQMMISPSNTNFAKMTITLMNFLEVRIGNPTK